MSTTIIVHVMKKDCFTENFPDVNLDDLPVHVNIDRLVYSSYFGDPYPTEHPYMSGIHSKMQRIASKINELCASAMRLPPIKVCYVLVRIKELLDQLEKLENIPQIDPAEMIRHERCVEAWKFFMDNADMTVLGKIPD